MPIDDIINAVLKAEVGDKPDGGYTNDPADAGGRTQYGISEKSNPEAWADGKVTEAEAREIYLNKYVRGPGFDKIANSKLQHFVVDWGVISGPAVAIRYLQQVIGVKVDGIMGDKSLTAINSGDARVILNRVVSERLKMIGRIVQDRPSQLKYLEGWINRCCEFLV